MEKIIKSFESYLNEYWTTDAPGTVVVPGDWFKDGVNSKNYKPKNTTMPHVVDAMYEDSEFESILDEMKKDSELIGKIKGSSDPLEILDIIRDNIKLKRSK